MSPDASHADRRRGQFEAEALPLMPVVYRVARRLVAGDAAQDLVQETYLRAYRTSGAFTPGTNCRAWLLTILYSVFVNRYRKARREPEMVPIEEERLRGEVPLDPAGWDSPAIEAALAALPEAFRATVLLVDVEELTYEEAAAALGCAVGTIRSRLSRARARLFTALSDHAQRVGYLKR